MGKMICGPCKEVFKDEATYLAHKCKVAGGAKPTEPEYLKRTTTPHLDKISEAAIKRGKARIKK